MKVGIKMAENTNKPCLQNYTTKEIMEEFPLKKCEGCPHKSYDDDEGMMYCSRNMPER
jgi:hypothetical protein